MENKIEMNETNETIDRNSKEQFLIAPFDTENQQYICQCNSCNKNIQDYKLLPRLFCIGLIFTPSLIHLIVLWFYNEFYLEHKVKHEQLEEMDYPTEFERQLSLQRTKITLPQNINDISNQINALDGIYIAPKDVIIDEIRDREQYKYEFSKQVAMQIMKYHDNLRKYFNKWAWRSITALLGHLIIIIILTCLLCSRSSA